jgi:hypothetical protein
MTVSCGTPMPEKVPRMENKFPLYRELNMLAPKKKTNAGIALLAVFLLILMSGCMNAKYGFPPNIDRLETLTPGVSSSSDVLLALGEPRAHGMSRWASPSDPSESAAWDIWEYEYTVREGRDVHLTILILFFRGDVYDSHLWFSSNLEIKEE